jgi:uncharacterized protein (TIRG00374 family)
MEMNTRTKALAAAALGLALTVGVPFALGGSAAMHALAGISPGLMLCVSAFALVAGAAKAVKLHVLWRQLGARPRFARSLAISLAGDLAFLATPAGAGGYVVSVALLRRAGASWSMAASVVGAEQALDLVFFAALVPLAALSALGPVAEALARLAPSVHTALGVALGGSVLLAFALWLGRRRAAGALATLVRGMPALNGGEDKLRRFWAELREQAGRLLRADSKYSIGLLAATGVQWFARYGVLWLVLYGLGHALPFGFLFVLQADMLHLAQWTGIPGGGGGADLGIAAALAPWLATALIVPALALWRLGILYVPLLLGGAAFAALGREGLWDGTDKAGEGARSKAEHGN